MAEGINLEERLYELAGTVATAVEVSTATSEALERHERVCADRYGWVLKVVVGSAATTIGALLTLSFLLLDKIL